MTLDLENQIVDTWNINNRINLYLLEAIPPGALNDVSASKGRTVAEQVAHLHNVRLMWLKASGPELMGGLEKIEKETAADKKLLARSLKDSGKAMETLLKKSLENGGKIKGFKPHITAFRVAAPRPDRALTQAVRSCARQKGRVRNLGMGREIDDAVG
jgi:hypothetical protein